MKLLFAVVATLTALVLGIVLYGWRYRDPGHLGERDWREGAPDFV